MVSRRHYLAVVAATAAAGCGSSSESDDGSGATGGAATTASDRRGPGPGDDGVETRTAERTVSTPGDPPSGDAVAWSVPVGAPVTARPVVAGDGIFLGSGEHDRADRPEVDAELRPRFPGFVHAVGLDGTRRFEYAAPAPVLDVRPVAGDDAADGDDAGESGAGGDNAGESGAGGDDASTPAALLGAYAVLGWYGGPGGVAHRVTRVTRGRPRWADATADANRFVAASTADAVVTGTRDERVALTGERLTARSPGGGFRWRVGSGDVLAGTGSDGRAYLTVGTRKTQCLDARTGETIWSYRGIPPTWTPRVQGDVVFVARNERTSMGGHPLVALDAVTGERRWTFAGTGDEAFTPVSATRQRAAPTADAVVYVAGTNGDLWAVGDGSRRWRVGLGGRIVDGPVVAGPNVYATDTHGVLHALDAESGERQWQVALDLPSRTLDANVAGVVVAAASDGAPHGDAFVVRGYDHGGRERFAADGDEGLLAAFAHDGVAYAVTDAGHLARFGDATE